MNAFEIGAIIFLVVIVVLVIWNIRGHRRDLEVDADTVNSFHSD